MKRLLDQDTLRAMARGCAVLGAGGGGDTYYTLLQALQATEDFGPVTLVDLDELAGDDMIMPCGGVGAPLVALEKIEAGDEGERLRGLMQRQTGRTVAALMAAVITAVGAFRLVGGKVLDVSREVSGGFMRGSVVIEGLGQDAGRLIRLELQNEHLVALERGRLLASVPDLITMLDSETADAISADRVRYGQRLVVIAFGCDPVWRTERGIAATGPRAFGYDFDFVPVEELAADAGTIT